MKNQASPLLPHLNELSDKVVGEYAGVLQTAEVQEIMVELVAYRAMAKAQGIESSEFATLSFVFALGYITGYEAKDAG